MPQSLRVDHGWVRAAEVRRIDAVERRCFQIGGTFGGTASGEWALRLSLSPISYSKSEADGWIRTGDPLFTNQDLSRPPGVVSCQQVSFCTRPPETSCQYVSASVDWWSRVWWYFGGTARSAGSVKCSRRRRTRVRGAARFSRFCSRYGVHLAVVALAGSGRHPGDDPGRPARRRWPDQVFRPATRRRCSTG